MYYLPGKIFAAYFVLTPDIASSYEIEGADSDGIYYKMHPVQMLSGNYALTLGSLNMPILTPDLFTQLSGMTPTVVSCCDFEDHTNYHQIVSE